MGSKLDPTANPNWTIIANDTVTHWDWIDRIRILFRGVTNSRMRYYTKNENVEVYATEVHISAKRIFPRKQTGCYATEAEEAGAAAPAKAMKERE
jgi:hypothetical protein